MFQKFQNSHGRRRLFVLLLMSAFACNSQALMAEVRLENTIKKVETFVNTDGEVERRLVDVASVVPGDELQYTVSFTNAGNETVDAGTIVITDAIPAHTFYVDGTAYGAGTKVSYSVDGQNFAAPARLKSRKSADEVAQAAEYAAIQWAFTPELKPGETGRVTFNVRLK